MGVAVEWTCDNPIDYDEHVWKVIAGLHMPPGWGVDEQSRLLCPTCWGLR
jgi:hypothetical protein